MSYAYRCLISVGAMIALLTIAAVQDSANAIAQPGQDIATDGAVSDNPFAPGKQPAAQPNDDPFGAPTRQPRARADDTTPSARPPQRRVPSDLDRQLFRAAQDAYVVSLDAFRAGKNSDPEVLYRWSLRLMKAEQAVGEDQSAAAAKQHLRRMSELADFVKQNASAAADPASTSTESAGDSLQRFAVDYYRREADALLADATARPDSVAASSHDAAIGIAEQYVKAVLQGNTDAAAKLALPGSIAASVRLMESFKGFASAQSFRISGIQGVGPDTKVGQQTNVLIEGTNSDDTMPGVRPKARFSVTLVRKDGRWLVTNFSAHNSALRQNNTALGTLPQPVRGETANRIPTDDNPFGDPRDASPKGTKVFRLAHAEAPTLKKTLVDLLLGTFEFNMVADERTNTLLVHGTREAIKAVEDLLQVLDAPGPERTSIDDGESGAGLIQTPRSNFGGAR